MIDWKLFNKDTNREVEIGDKIVFPMRDQMFQIVGLEPPHKSDSSGKIVVKLVTDAFVTEPRTVFCHVFNCEFRAHRLSKDG